MICRDLTLSYARVSKSRQDVLTSAKATALNSPLFPKKNDIGMASMVNVEFNSISRQK